MPAGAQPDPPLGNAAIITLAGGAQARNIFWRVAGQATIVGRALAQTAATLNATTVTNP